MEVFLKIVKIFFIVIMTFCMVVSFLLLSMTVHLILKSFIDVSSSHSHNYIDIFEIKNKQYVLKVIGKNQTNVGSEISGLFSYNIVKKDVAHYFWQDTMWTKNIFLENLNMEIK